MTERVDHMLAALPRGNSLDDAAWKPRHRLLLWLLAAHLPALAGVAFLTGNTATANLLELVPIALALVVGIAARSRLPRSVAVTLGLVYSASVLVHFSGGMIQAHFHYFVVLGFVALYQDWRPYLAAVGYVVLGHGLAGVVAPGIVYNDPAAAGQPWLWALVHGGFVLAACAAHVVFWKQSERQQMAAEAYYAQLYEGERAVVGELRQAQRVKDELMGVVGHEFRTPLTSIQGFARTLEARYERMDREAVQACTQAIEREAKRLTRMVGNVLTASEDITPAGSDVCRLDEVIVKVVDEVSETMPMAAANLRTHVAPGSMVSMRYEHVHQIVFNLVDNAVKFAVPESDVGVSTRREGESVVLEVTNVGSPISPADRERIFDAFVQGDSSATRRHGGMGLGLHIARTIVSAYGGRIGAYCEGPIVIFRAWLPRASVSTGSPIFLDAPAGGDARSHDSVRHSTSVRHDKPRPHDSKALF